jgi:hypothetical protein
MMRLLDGRIDGGAVCWGSRGAKGFVGESEGLTNVEEIRKTD